MEAIRPIFQTRRLDVCFAGQAWRRVPWSYDQVWRIYPKAVSAAGIGRLGTHSLRHTYRTWLDSVGPPVGVQQKLMRHADIRTTMNIYGDAATADMAEAAVKSPDLRLKDCNRIASPAKSLKIGERGRNRIRKET